jgi:hypothetical protein
MKLSSLAVGETLISAAKIDKAKLERVLKKIPMKYRKGLTFQLVKDEPQNAVMTPFSGIVRIDEKLLRPHYHVSEWGRGKGAKDGIYTSINDFGLDTTKEFGERQLLHILAHEVGHYVWEKLEQQDKLLKKLEKQKVNTSTVRKYTRYVDEQLLEMDPDRVPACLRDKVSKEKFAEMFRLFLLEGKHKQFFEALKIG